MRFSGLADRLPAKRNHLYFYDMAPAHLVLTFALQHELLDRSLKALCGGIQEWKERQGA